MIFSYSTDYIPPAPIVEIQFGVQDESFASGPLQAFVDTGADISIVPFQYIESLSVQADDRRTLRSAWGEPRRVVICSLDIGIGEVRLPAVEVVADERGEEIILGRNVLNKLLLMLDGRNRTLKILD